MFQAHSGPVAKIRMSFDDQYLFSVGDDGCLIIYSILDKDGRVARKERDVMWAEEVLIGKADLEEKNSSMIELKTRVCTAQG